MLNVESVLCVCNLVSQILDDWIQLACGLCELEYSDLSRGATHSGIDIFQQGIECLSLVRSVFQRMADVRLVRIDRVIYDRTLRKNVYLKLRSERIS